MASITTHLEFLSKITSKAAEAEASQSAVIQHLKEELRKLKEENQQLKGSLAALAVTAVPAEAQKPQPVNITLPVVCTADSRNLTRGHIHVSDFDRVIAFSYTLKKNLGSLFETMSEKDFKEYLKTLHRCDNGDPISGYYAGKIYTFMKMALWRGA